MWWLALHKMSDQERASGCSILLMNYFWKSHTHFYHIMSIRSECLSSVLSNEKGIKMENCQRIVNIFENCHVDLFKKICISLPRLFYLLLWFQIPPYNFQIYKDLLSESLTCIQLPTRFCSWHDNLAICLCQKHGSYFCYPPFYSSCSANHQIMQFSFCS